MIGRVSFGTIDATDPDRLAGSWAEILGTAVGRRRDEGRFVFLREASGHVLGFHRVPEPQSVKNRVHLDIRVEDLEEARDAVLDLVDLGTGTSARSTMHDGERCTIRKGTSSTSS